MMTPLLISSTAALAISLLVAWKMIPFVARTVRFEPAHWDRDIIIMTMGLYWLYGFGMSVAFIWRHFAGAPAGWYMPWYLVALQCVVIVGGALVLVMMRMSDGRR